jgi:hypothetical protein
MSLTTAAPYLLRDPGFLFWANLLTAEPAHAATGSSYDLDPWPVGFINLGPTDDGNKFNYETKLEPINVAEFLDPVVWATTERNGNISFALANWTLKNLQRAFNGGALSTVSGSGATLSSKLEPPDPGTEIRAMIGWESQDHTVRLVIRQAIQGGAITLENKKAPAKGLIPMQFNFEVPLSGAKPFSFYGAGTARLGS